MKRYLYPSLVAGILTSMALAQNPNLGTAGAQFLKLPVGARAIGMGGAAVGITGDASSVFWNPAGIAAVNRPAAHFSHMNMFKYFDFSAASLAFHAPKLGHIAVGVLVFSMQEMETTTEFEPLGTGHYFDAQDIALGVTYARSLTDRFHAGISGKYIYQRIWNETAQGVAFDLGTQYRIDFMNLTLAMSMFNFGPEMRLAGPELNVTYDSSPEYPNRLVPAQKQTETYPLPLTFKFGLALDIINTPLLKMRGGLDAVHPLDNDERIQVGTEISFADRFFIRGGYKFNHDSERGNAGIGIHTSVSGLILSLDYAYSVNDLLPDVQQLSVGFRF